jgi:hypothetical protein
MQTPIFVGIAVVALLVLLRHIAARRVLARDGRYVWLMFIPMVFGGLAIVWAALQVFNNSPVVGALMMVAGVLYLALIGRFLSRLSRTVTATGPQEDISAAITEPLADYMASVVASC